MRMKSFTLTEDHVKLLTSGRVGVGWQDCETGAPEIDPKRPYGNSNVAEDVAEILGWELEGDDGYEPVLSRKQREAAMAIHRSTRIALEVILSAKTFEPGVYEASAYSSKWRQVE